MSNRFHNKFHRFNHHSTANPDAKFPDSGYDPIASYNSPFQGEFYSQGDILTTENLSAEKDLGIGFNAIIGNNLIVGYDASIQNNLNVGNDAFIENDLTVQGNFTVLGTTSQLDTLVYVTSALSVTNTGTDTAATITQTGSADVAQFIDDGITALIIKNGGNIGINTDSPNEKLTINGNLSTNGNGIFTNSIYVSGNTFLENNLSVNTNVLFVDSFTDRVGIGTNTPSTVLHISGSDGLVIPVGDISQRTNIKGAIRFNSQDQLFEGFDGTNWGSLGGVKDVDQDTYITAEDSPGSDNDQLKFFTNSIERMRILSGGNIGIGVTDPSTKLHVGGNGAIIVPIGTTANRPDSITTSLTGAIRLNTDIKDFEGFNGTDWRLLGDYTFTKNLTCSIDPAKSFGRYRNLDIIQSLGKTVAQVLEMAVVEPITPGVSLTTATTIDFNQTAVSNLLTFNHQISSLGASVQTASLEWRRNNTGSWTVLSTSLVSSGSFTHTLTDTAFNTQPFNYRYIVTDSVGATATATVSITPQSYAAPTVSSINVGTTTRYKGDTNTTYIATLTRNRQFVPIASYQLQRTIDAGTTWTNVGALIFVTGNPSPISINITDTNISDNAVLNTNSLQYRIQYTDSFITTLAAIATSTSSAISLVHRNALIFSANTSITIANIDSALIVAPTSPGAVLSNSRARTINNVTASAGQYTYYAYVSSAGNLSLVIQDGALPVLGAFGTPADITGTNSNNANVTYRVYRSNATQAFTTASLQFS